MNEKTLMLNPAWARRTALQVILGRQNNDADGCLVFHSDIMEECMDTVFLFDELSQEDQDRVFDLVFEAVDSLVDDGILLVEDLVFEINPDLKAVLAARQSLAVLQ